MAARADELVRTGQMTREQADLALSHFGSIPPVDGAEPVKPGAPEEPKPLADPLGKISLDQGLPDRPADPAASGCPGPTAASS